MITPTVFHSLHMERSMNTRQRHCHGCPAHLDRPDRSFLDCVKSRQPTTDTAETMHQRHLTLHIGYLSILLGRKLRWDSVKEEFINDAEANALRVTSLATGARPDAVDG